MQRIKDTNDIVEVVSEYLSLKKKGINYIGLCPFHPDSHPSMTVSRTRGTYKCFVCGAGGDVISFIQEVEGKTFYEAVRQLAERANIELPNTATTDEDRQRIQDTEARRVAIAGAHKFFRQHLTDASAYLQSRGYDVDDATLQEFQLGYAPEGNLATKTLLQLGYSEARLIELDILKRNDRGHIYDTFRDRIMFPFLDIRGKVVGFTGRYVTPQDHAGKYVNTGDTPLFKKGLHVFGLYQAKREIARRDSAYIVEGQFDAISLYRYGVKNAVATSGTALTPEQISSIARFTQSVSLVYDSDRAGIAASEKNCIAFLEAGFRVSCVLLPEGLDPDNLAQQQRENTGMVLSSHKRDFITHFVSMLITEEETKDVNAFESAVTRICRMLAVIPSATYAQFCAQAAAEQLGLTVEALGQKIREIKGDKKSRPAIELKAMEPGIYGIDEAKAILEHGQPVLLTSDFDEFLAEAGDTPTVYIKGIPDAAAILKLRQLSQSFYTEDHGICVSNDGTESEYTTALRELYLHGVSGLTVTWSDRFVAVQENEDGDEESVIDEAQSHEDNFARFYVRMISEFLEGYKGERSSYIEHCAEIIAQADDSVRIINLKVFHQALGLTKAALQELMRPYLAKKKSRLAINAQRADDDYDEMYDPDELPSYVEENKDYMTMYKQCGYYPKLNKEGEPVCYMFKNEKSGHTMVGDFYMIPLLHIYSDNPDDNKRIFKINRRYYKNPLFIELQSKFLTKKSTLEERLIMLEAVNFTNGEEKHWIRIREYMSRHYITCTEIETYGNQQSRGTSLKPDEQFFAFANGIYHTVDDIPKFEPVNELGVVEHNGKNYYLPAFSTIYAGSGKQNEKYEMVSQLMYNDIPAAKQCSFEKWASLMNEVYKINDNGKWALLFAVMCAFRSNIHAHQRLFTAPFFMGPMSSGKTQIAISIRSLFVGPQVSVFNLNYGTDAALATLMSTFRDVPVVLDEYNNKDISDNKFQMLKSIVYDGEGKMKRKGVGTKDIETDKVYTPVVICGQETPQRDDNALMSRIIVCEVPKPKNRTLEEVALFEQLKEIEDPEKVGLSNVLLQILALRPIVMRSFHTLKKECYEQLKKRLTAIGEVDRLMKTVSMFLATCQLIEKHTSLKLPFTYDEFFEIAVNKVTAQMEMITRSDKLAGFFKAMDVMVDTGTIMEGRDFAIDTPQSITVKEGSASNTIMIEPGKKVLFIRLSSVYAQYARSAYNPEQTTQSTIEQNLRSHKAYLGLVRSRRFTWMESKERSRADYSDVPNGTGIEIKSDNVMVKKMEKRQATTSCVAIDYDSFREFYDIDFQRQVPEEPLTAEQVAAAQPLGPTESVEAPF